MVLSTRENTQATKTSIKIMQVMVQTGAPVFNVQSNGGRGLILTQHVKNVIILTWNQHKKLPKWFTFLFCCFQMKTSKSNMNFILRRHLSSDRARVQCSITTCGYWRPHTVGQTLAELRSVTRLKGVLLPLSHSGLTADRLEGGWPRGANIGAVSRLPSGPLEV